MSVANGVAPMNDQALLRLYFVLIYVPIFIFSYLWTVSRASPLSRRLASVMLALQLLITGMAIEFGSMTDQAGLLLHIGAESNIPSILASLQLAMTGGLALATLWHTRPRASCRFFQLLGVGLLFIYLGLDEYLSWKSHFHTGSRDWYIAVGAALAAMTLVAALRPPGRGWRWTVFLLTGLLLIATGGIAFDYSSATCNAIGVLCEHNSQHLGFHEELLEIAGGWLAFVAVLGWFSEAVAAPSSRVQRAIVAFPLLWILLITHYSLFLYLEVRLMANQTQAEFEHGVTLYGFKIDTYEEAAAVRLYAHSMPGAHYGTGFAVHLVDQATGESIASQNTYALRDATWPFHPYATNVYRQRMLIDLPPETPVNRALWVVLTLWREKDGRFENRKVIASDHQLLSDTQLVLGELTFRADAVAVPVEKLADFDKGVTLYATDLPEHLQIDKSLSVTFSWGSSESGHEDYVQFLHLGHVESGAWWVVDQQPLGARLPTRLWTNGLIDSETWEIPVPADLRPGAYAVYTGLYRSSSQERLPATDGAGRPFVDARVPLGTIVIDR